MSITSHVSQDTESLGRLPAPEEAALLSLLRFEELADVWRSCGVWLSLWNLDGALRQADDQAAAFWHQLARADGVFVKALGARLVEALRTLPNDLPDAPLVLHPWGDGISFLVVPIRAGHRMVGAAVGGILTTSTFDESLIRLCDQCGLDRSAMEGLAKQVAGVSRVEESVLWALLSQCIRQACHVESGRQEIASLTRNLETTYEELHLVYTISGKMSLTKRTSEVLHQVAEEVLVASRAAAVAIVLRGEEIDFNDVMAEQPWSRPSDRIVQVGQGAPTLQLLERLAESLPLSEANAPPHVLINQPAERPEMAWALPWLRHLVAIPLQFQGHLAGVMLAMNCTDAGDFTSVDVQLYRAVGDRVALYLENHRLYGDLNDLLMGMLHALVRSIDAKDTYTCGHSERVAYYGRRIAQQAGLPAATCERIFLAGLLHDVGKIGVPDAILCKKGRLTTEEFEHMKKHPEIGVRILAQVRQIQDLLPGVMHHHERVDGGGYPDGLSGERIPLIGRILCIADCFDAMTTHRTYRAALTLSQALDELRRCSGTQFDAELVQAFLSLDHAALFREVHAMAGTEDDMRYHPGAIPPPVTTEG